MGRPHLNHLARLRVVVLLGGPSAEREVSLKSGAAVAQALSEAGHAVSAVDPASIDLATYDWSGVDAVFIALHGQFGEDGQVQQLLETAGVPYTGSGVAASRLAISKSAAKERFLQQGVPTARYMLIHESDPAGRIVQQAQTLGYPVVVKPDTQGSSIGVSIVREACDLPQALARCFQHDSFGILEPFIPGTEWTAGFLDNEALPLIRIGTNRGFFDYEAKYQDDSTEYDLEAELPPAVRAAIGDAAAAACRALETRGVARVDLMLDQQNCPWVLEVNTIPGFTDHSLVPKAALRAGIHFTELCERCLRSALAEAGNHASRSRTNSDSRQ